MRRSSPRGMREGSKRYGACLVIANVAHQRPAHAGEARRSGSAAWAGSASCFAWRAGGWVQLGRCVD
jgi:hypothetical protein